MVRDMRNLELFRNLGWLYGELLPTLLKTALLCRRSSESRLIVLSV